MKNMYRSAAFLMACLLLSAASTYGQTWTVGQPVLVNFTSVGGYAGGCYPNPDFEFSFPGSNVSGVNYYFVVTATPANVILQPMNDTIALGDTILMPPGNSSYSVSCYSGTGGPVTFNIIAQGTPTTVGQPYPCSVSQLWLSNLMLCPEGLINNVSNNCSTQAGSSGIQDPSNEPLVVLPDPSNNQTLSIAGPFQEWWVSDISGKVLYRTSNLHDQEMIMTHQPSGIYIVTVRSASGLSSRKFSLR